MCLEKVEESLYNGVYSNVHLFAKDARQIFINAKSYNPEGNQVHQWAVELEALVNKYVERATEGRNPQEDNKKMQNASLSNQELKALQDRIQ
eukprot:UN27179